jgi:hypothetical protein
VDIVIEEDSEKRILDSPYIPNHFSVHVFFIHGAVGVDIQDDLQCVLLKGEVLCRTYSGTCL